MRFILDVSCSTGLRASERTLRSVQTDSPDSHWLALVGKGSQAGKVALPPLARSALNQYFSQRGLPTTPLLWKPDTALIGALRHGAAAGITDTRLRSLMGRFFKQAAERVDADNRGLAHKLRRARPTGCAIPTRPMRWVMVPNSRPFAVNLRHGSISTTSIYLHADDLKRARQLSAAFSPRA